MNYLVTALGALVLTLGAIIVVKPELIFSFLRKRSESLMIHILAVVVRLILGLLLIAHAAESRYPIALEVLGWISLVAAITLGAIGRSKFKRLMKWALGLGPSLGRLGGFFGVLFGGFLIYATL